jgi:hypothetical protein
MKTSELTGAALDWAVAKCEGMNDEICFEDAEQFVLLYHDFIEPMFHFSDDWAQGGPIIEREKIEWQWLPASDKAHQYGARKPSLGGLNRTFCMDGPTVLIAAMRCYVASQLGDEVDVPEELK